MAPTHVPSLAELRRQSERSREALAETVGELRERIGDSAAELRSRVSPAYIKQEINDYISSGSKNFAASVKIKATENPLQLAAFGAALAYPGWRLVRAIPTPLLLIGAGLFFTSKRGQQSAVAATAKIGEVVQQGSDRVVDATAAIRSDVADRLAATRSAADDIRDTAASAAGTVMDKARTTFHDAAGTVKAVAANLPGIPSDAAANVLSAAADGAGAAKDRAVAASAGSRDAIVSFVNDNALLVAGVGAALGMFIAASLPTSEAENRLFGTGSAKLKDKAKEAAAQGIEKASAIAAEAAGSVAAAAAREGLDASGVQDALSTVADSVRAVADRGLNTALGTGSEPTQEPVIERTPS